MIPFNKPYLSGKELLYIQQSLGKGKICGNGEFTKKCQLYWEKMLHSKKCLLTTSCTDALEMSALLANIKEGDEVIIPSYTFVSSALAFVRQGAKIIFADSCNNNPCIDATGLEKLITEKTRMIVPVHYAGIACDMDMIMSIAQKYNLIVVEDAAQAIDSYYKGIRLGSIGHLATFSFHETKNIQCGEGGMLVINDDRFLSRAEILWEKGTNRAEFFRGEVNKYGWVDLGSSFLPAEYVASFLWAQLEQLSIIQKRRKEIWEKYYKGLQGVSEIDLPYLPDYATNNGHIFYLVCKNLTVRSALIEYLKQNDVQAVFHYLCLHQSSYIQQRYGNKVSLPQAERYTSCLVRLPLFYDLEDKEIEFIIDRVKEFFI